MSTQVNSKWRVATIILAIVVMMLSYEHYRIKNVLKSIFHYEVIVTVKDKNTGKVLDGVGISIPGTSSDDVVNQSGSLGTRPGSSLELGGIAYEPRTYTFKAEGYQQKDLVITEGTAHEVTIELEPLK